jgi:HK97 family phage major capsid protein
MRGLSVLMNDGHHNAGKVSAASGHSAFTTIDTTDLGNLVGSLASWGYMGARWYAHPYAIGALFSRLGASAGSSVGPDGRPYMSYLGWPVEACDLLPGNTTLTGSVALLFGDLGLATTLGSRRDLRIRRLTERYIDADQIGYQITSRFDIACHDIGDNTNPGGLVALVGG